MLEGDKTLEAVMNRYKLGLAQAQASREVEAPCALHPSWRDRFYFNLGKLLIALGSRLQHRHAATSAAYHPAYPVN
jgi:hypothetical protein